MHLCELIISIITFLVGLLCCTHQKVMFNSQGCIHNKLLLYNLQDSNSLFYSIVLAVVEAILAVWMIFWRGLLSLAVEPFVSRILFPLSPFTYTLHSITNFVTVSLGEVACFPYTNFSQNSLITLQEFSCHLLFSDRNC